MSRLKIFVGLFVCFSNFEATIVNQYYPQNVIFYTVMGHDYDDVCALVVLHTLAVRGEDKAPPCSRKLAHHVNCHSNYYLSDPDGSFRLFVFAGTGSDGGMYKYHSDDDGKT